MASQAQVTQLRLLIGDSDLTDEQLGVIIDSEQTIQGAAAQVWQSVAGEYADLVNISEAGSSRSLGSLHQNALNMAKYYRGLDSPSDQLPGAVAVTRTRAIERP